jgi:hypothetical protein
MAKDIEFPVVVSGSLRRIVSFKKVKAKAINKGVYDAKTGTIEIGFLKDKNELIWKFIKEITINSDQIVREEALFDFANGKYIKTDFKTLYYVN